MKSQEKCMRNYIFKKYMKLKKHTVKEYSLHENKEAIEITVKSD